MTNWGSEGLPLAKDSTPIKGLRSTNGSLINKNRVDQHTSPSIERLWLVAQTFLQEQPSRVLLAFHLSFTHVGLRAILGGWILRLVAHQAGLLQL